MGVGCGILTLSCSMWDLIPGPPVLGAQILSHWITREIPVSALIIINIQNPINIVLLGVTDHSDHYIAPRSVYGFSSSHVWM